MTSTNSPIMAQITINIPESDLSILKRIAEHDNRRLKDLIYLCLGYGISTQYCDQCVFITLNDDELSDEQHQQIKKNEELRDEKGFWDLTKEERQAKGYKPEISKHLSNHDCNQEDHLVEPLSKRIQKLALD